MKTKWNLTKSEQRAHSENAERLKSGGVALGVEKTASSEPPRLRVEQSEYSFVYAGDRKGFALAVCVELMALKSGITICDYEITIPGYDGTKISLVPVPEGSLTYKAFEWLDIERSAVVNHLILNKRPLPRGRLFDGILVAKSHDSLPSQFQNRMRVGATIYLADQLYNSYTSEVELIVARDDQPGAPVKQGDRLYAAKQVPSTHHQRQVHAQPVSAVGKTVSAVEENAGDRV